MVINSFSKINLTLLVNAKQKNGYHNIQSYFCLINLKDKINVKKIKGKKDKIKFTGTFARLVNKKENSIKSILILMRNLNLTKSYYSISVEKKIPVFAGLGGGTSNAYTLMKHILRNKFSNKNLNIIEKKIGTDFNLFFHKTGFLKSLGSVVNFKMKQKLFFVLIQPPFKCSTKNIYSKVNNYSKKTTFIRKKIVKKKEFLNFLSQSRNDLQSVVEKKYPKIERILNNISIQKGCCFSRMTGSGSVCYGLFIDQNSAKKALNKLKYKYPKFWVSFAKTV